MKHLLLILPLAACAPHVYVKEHCHVEMDRPDRAAFLDHNHHHGADGDDNGAGSASSDTLSDDSNGDGSDDLRQIEITQETKDAKIYVRARS